MPLRATASRCLLFAASLLLLGGCGTPVARFEGDTSQRDVRTYLCPRVTGPVVIDGKLDDPAWRSAVRIDRLFEVRKRPEWFMSPATGCRFLLMHDDRYLYVAAEVDDDEIIVDSAIKSGEKEALQLAGDTFEIFVQPDPAKSTYFEFHINPDNLVWDGRYRSVSTEPLEEVVRWDSHAVTAVSVRGTRNSPEPYDLDVGWTVECAIPLASFTDENGAAFDFSAGRQWRFLLSVCNYSRRLPPTPYGLGRHLLTTAKVSRANFHVREDYDLLQFE